MGSISSATNRESRLVGAKAVVRMLNNLACYRGFAFDEITWLTDPAEEARLGIYLLLGTTAGRHEEVTFLQRDLESMDSDALARRRVAKSLSCLINAVAA